MKLIKPAEISAKIMTLIDDAEKELIIVSPYNLITGWDKLIIRIKKAQAKDVDISWYSRKNHTDENNIKEVKKNLGIDPILIDDLHAKIYMNDGSAIFTSMNMSKISDDKSIDLGYITTNQEEYDEIRKVFKKYILPAGRKKEITKTDDLAHQKSKAKQVPSLVKISKNLYINQIHDYICNKYKFRKYRYNDTSYEEFIEYNDFMKPGVKMQIIPYTQAIKIQIFLPLSKPAEKVLRNILKYDQSFKLLDKEELDFNQYTKDNYIKYYHQQSDLKVKNWSKDDMQKFLDDMDILFELVIHYI